MTSSSNLKNNYTNYANYIPVILVSTVTAFGTLIYYFYNKKQRTEKSSKIISNEGLNTLNSKYETNVIIDEKFDVYIKTQHKINTDILQKYDNQNILFKSVDKAINQVEHDNKTLKEQILNNDKAIKKNTLELQILKEKFEKNTLQKSQNPEYSFFNRNMCMVSQLPFFRELID